MFSKTGWNWTVFFCCVLFIFLSSQTFATVSEHLNQIQSNPRALYTFFKEMPKGGELHYHFSGSVDAEVMLSLAKQEKFCLDPKTFIMSHYLSECHGITAKQLASTPALYEQTVQAWSMKHFIPEKESAHDHFFNVFAKIDAVVHQHPEQLLATIMQKAADQKELYLEIIFFNLDNASHFTNQIENAKKFSDKRRILLADKRFQSTVNQSVLESKRWLAGARNRLNCGTSPAKSVCNLTVKFQYFIKRSEPLSQIFTQALAAFEAASKSKEIVGINLVQAEDGATSLHDYDAQMQIIQFLHNVYPQVHIALHAGELTPSLTSLKNLRFHIRHAVRLGHAERIGHGVDIAYENDHTILLDEMAKKSIAVEINLSSNRAILNVHGKQHSFPYYLKHNVPVVLSTDDEGILRTDLTQQFVDAVLTYHLPYATIKAINRNSLTYSFLPGKSIWQTPNEYRLIPECETFDSQSCHKFIQRNEKARLQWQLEKQLSAFECKWHTEHKKTLSHANTLE